MRPAATLACLALLLLAACRPAPQSPADAPSGATDTAAAAPVAKAPEPAMPAGASADTPARPTHPVLEVDTVDGKRFDLAGHRGRWVVVNFWATWCSPCLKEMPELSALDAMREHIDVVGLAYEDIDPAAMRAFLVEHPVAYPIAIVDVYDPPKDFDAPRGLPVTYLVAPDGRVARQFLGPVTARELEAAIAAEGGPKAG